MVVKALTQNNRQSIEVVLHAMQNASIFILCRESGRCIYGHYPLGHNPPEHNPPRHYPPDIIPPGYDIPPVQYFGILNQRLIHNIFHQFIISIHY